MRRLFVSFLVSALFGMTTFVSAATPLIAISQFVEHPALQGCS